MSCQVKFKGNALTLVGRVLKVGMASPDFKVTSQDMKEVRLSDFSGKVKILTSFPSIDTPVCDLQVKEFNKRASAFPDAVIVGISMDLPFAQQRFCESFEIKNVRVVSDYKTSSFGINYGLLIKELNLLARSVIILDRSDVVQYIQIVEEITTPPDFETALSKLEAVIKSPAPSNIGRAKTIHCKPCEVGAPQLKKSDIDRSLGLVKGWALVEDRRITKDFKFKDFIEAKYFLDLISIVAEEQGHHPTLTLAYNKLKVTLTTHAAGALTENDFIMAEIIDEMGPCGDASK